MSASARENFVAYHPHVDFRDGKKNPVLFLIWRFTLIFGAILLAVWSFHWLAGLNRNLRKQSDLVEEGNAILRFSTLYRWIHLLAMACVLGLTLTGLPLKFSRHSWMVALMVLFGGPDTAAIFHRLFAVLLVGIGLFHGISALILRGEQKQPLLKRIFGPNSLLPNRRDAHQFVEMLRWFTGRGPRPELNRWSYREKFDYLAVAITVSVIALSGLFLWFPTFVARFFSGYWINVAMVVHAYAGLMAIGFILMIHLFNTSLRRKGFPVNDVMFTGRLSEQEMQEERSAQYASMVRQGTLSRFRVPPESTRKRKIAFYATLALQVLGVGIFILIIIATMT